MRPSEVASPPINSRRRFLRSVSFAAATTSILAEAQFALAGPRATPSINSTEIEGIEIGLHRLLDREILRGLDELFDQLQALAEPAQKAFIDFVGELEITLKQLVVELGLEFLELVDIGLEEVHFPGVQGLEEALKEAA